MTERGASTGIRGPAAPSSIFRAKVARALDSRRVSLLAAREARIKVAIVAVDSVAVYTWAETAEVNQGAFVPVAVSQAKSAMPAKRMPKKTVRTKGHRRLLPVASNEARSSRGSASLPDPGGDMSKPAVCERTFPERSVAQTVKA